MINFTTFKNTGGGQPVQARESSQNAYSMSRARTAPTFYIHENRTTMRRKSFTPTAAEIEYWRKIHDLNQQEKPAVPIGKPAPVYVITTVELTQAEVTND
jgi:hypothetical protein